MINHHSLFILEDEAVAKGNGNYRNYNSLYFVIAEYLQKGYGVIYVAENELPAKTIRNMKNTTGIDIEAYVEGGALTVIDYSKLYDLPKLNSNGYLSTEQNEMRNDNGNNGNNIQNTQSLVKRLQSEIKKKKQNNKYRHFLIVGTCKPFSERDDYEGLISYENALNNELLISGSSQPYAASTKATSIECICCYRDTTIKQVIASMRMMASIILSHDSIAISSSNGYNRKDEKINEGMKIQKNNLDLLEESEKKITTPSTIIKPLYPGHKIISAIRLGIDKTVGNNTSNLILKTMKLIYRIDEDIIIKQPKLFADTLVKIIGDSAAKPILFNILEELRQQVLDGSTK
jgi:hypothetical protein